MLVRCLHCHEPIEVPEEGDLSKVECSACGGSFSLVGETTAPYTQARRLAHFELVEEVGVGAFGSVWKARDTRLDRIVAVKIPRAGRLDADEAEMFLREARAAAQLKHPGIVPVHEVGREDDTLYIVSDLVEGATLDDWLTARRLNPREAAELCLPIAEALDHAHQTGVVHRDLKPGNIMLDLSGRPHLLDFGLARRAEREATMTVAGRVLGTPAYMSPEQARGEAHTADHRTDIYSLGVILFRLLTGELPFRGNAKMLIVQILQDEPPSPRRLNGHVPRDLETICLKCLEKDPGKRYATAQALADDFRHYLAGEPIEARPMTRLARGWRWCQRKPVVASLTAAVAILLVAGTVVSSFFAILAKQRAELANEKMGIAQREQQRATEEANTNRRLLYVSDMHLAGRAWDANDLQTVERLLKWHRPKTGEDDLRGFECYYLWRRWRRNWELLNNTHLPQYASKLAVSPSGRLLAAASNDGLVALWDIPSQKKIADFGVFKPSVPFGNDNLLAFSPDSSTLVYARGDFTKLIVRDLDGAKESLLELKDGATFTAAAFLPRRGTLATSSSDGRIRIWDVTASGEPLEFEKHSAALQSIATSPDGRRVVSGGEEGTVLVWDTTSGRQVAVFRGQTGNIFGVAFSPDGKQIASASADRSVKLWDAESGALLRSLQTFRDEARSVAFSPDGTLLAAGDRDGVVRLWNTKNFVELEPIKGALSAATTLGFLPDGRLVFGTQNRTIAICRVDLDADDFLAAGSAYVEQLEMARCGNSLILAAATDQPPATGIGGTARSKSFAQIRLWRVESDRVSELPPIQPDWPIGCMAFSTAGVLAIGEYEARRVALFDPLTRAEIESVAASAALGPTKAAFSPDGRRLAVGFADGKIVFWRLENGRITGKEGVATSAGHDSPVRCLAFNGEGNLLVSGGDDHTVIVWNAESGEALRRLGPGTSSITAVAFSPDGDEIAAGSFVFLRGEIKVWAWSSGDLKCELSGHRLTVWALAFLKDRRTLVSAGGDRVVKIWDLPTRQERFNLAGNASIFHSLAISPDERLIAAGTRDGMIRLYRAATRDEVNAADW